MEALQEAYRQISSSAGECEDKRAEGSRTPLSLSTLQPASTVESGQTQLLANCCQSPSACLRFKPFDLLLFHRKCFQLCFKPKDVRFLALALFAAWVPLADSKQLDFVEDVTMTIFLGISKSSIGGLSPWSNMNGGGGGLNYCLWHFFLIPSSFSVPCFGSKFMQTLSKQEQKFCSFCKYLARKEQWMIALIKISPFRSTISWRKCINLRAHYTFIQKGCI